MLQTYVYISLHRVPFDSIASELNNAFGEVVSPLELICTAASKTQEYGVFGCSTVNLLLKYKWYGGAKQSFMREFCM